MALGIIPPCITCFVSLNYKITLASLNFEEEITHLTKDKSLIISQKLKVD